MIRSYITGACLLTIVMNCWWALARMLLTIIVESPLVRTINININRYHPC